MRALALLLIVLLGIVGCGDFRNSELKISTTTWIGYTPLFYAKEKGWLDAIDVKLLHVASLSENMYLYEAGNSDAYTGTQYEYNILKNKIPTLSPVIMLDRSNGGDLIMGNMPIEMLQRTDQPIDAYLEMDSINYMVLEDFIKGYTLESKHINYLNRDQSTIANMPYINERPTIIVTYIPYDTKLKEKGYQEIISTGRGLTILVVDALFTSQEVLNQHKSQFKELKKYINRALSLLHKDPKEYYTVIKPYLNNIPYDEFIKGLNDIEWISQKLSPELKWRLQKAQIPLRNMI